MRPQTRYAKSGDVNIAYQAVGEGPLDLVVIPGSISNVDFAWEDALYDAWVQRLAPCSRVILFDKRGTGFPDRDVGDSSLAERMDGLRAVLAAAGSEQAAVMGFSAGSPLSMLFAATYPERVRALILYASFARAPDAADHPEGIEWRTSLDAVRRALESAWREGTTLQLMAPELSHLPRARYVELPGTAHPPWVGDTAALVAEIQHFLTGSRPTTVEVERVLAARNSSPQGDTWRPRLLAVA
jgi:pimeloyl-ACP methyl ester carboxylesterase